MASHVKSYFLLINFHESKEWNYSIITQSCDTSVLLFNCGELPPILCWWWTWHLSTQTKIPEDKQSKVMSCLVSRLQESCSWLVWKAGELTHWQGQHQWDLIRMCLLVSLCVCVCWRGSQGACVTHTRLVVSSLGQRQNQERTTAVIDILLLCGPGFKISL